MDAQTYFSGMVLISSCPGETLFLILAIIRATSWGVVGANVMEFTKGSIGLQGSISDWSTELSMQHAYIKYSFIASDNTEPVRVQLGVSIAIGLRQSVLPVIY